MYSDLFMILIHKAQGAQVGLFRNYSEFNFSPVWHENAYSCIQNGGLKDIAVVDIAPWMDSYVNETTSLCFKLSSVEESDLQVNSHEKGV